MKSQSWCGLQDAIDGLMLDPDCKELLQIKGKCEKALKDPNAKNEKPTRIPIFQDSDDDSDFDDTKFESDFENVQVSRGPDDGVEEIFNPLLEQADVTTSLAQGIKIEEIRSKNIRR